MPKLAFEEVLSICKLLESRTGIVIKEDRVPQVHTILEDFLSIIGLSEYRDCYNLLSTIGINDTKFQVLIGKITIGETFFFRDQSQFQALQDVVLPKLLEKQRTTNRPISILSAACSTGEEIYSIAMTLHEIMPMIRPEQVKLIAGDINATSLEKARRAVYSKWSFRGVKPSIINKYFTQKDDSYHLSEKIRSMVTFQYLNLAEPFPFLELDIILLRNVLIYFTNGFIEQVGVRCANALKEDGLLLVGTSELNRQNFRQFEELYIKDAIFYQKKAENMGLSTSQAGTFPIKLEATIEQVQRNLLDSFRSPDSNSYKSFDSGSYKPFNTGSYKPFDSGSYKPFNTGSYKPFSPDSYKSIDKIEKVDKVEKTVDNKLVNDSYETALKHFERHEFSQAVKLLERIVDKDIRALLLMAKIEVSRGNNSKSEQFFKLYLDKDPNSIEAHYLLALTYGATNNLTKAAEQLRYTILLDNKFIMGHWNLALVYKKLDDKQAAKRHLSQVKKLLADCTPEAIIPFSEGQKAARILQIVEGMANNLL
jgi:chemotaxis protein methyltransferase CheR